ncbi:MAG: hypothetical protein JWO12_2545 [Frankiales bacterium]|jgi:hypothetical protein|nr:hypothetical protein [Frankiales bacterium]
MSKDLVEPEGVDSTREPPQSPPAKPPVDHGNAAPLELGLDRPAGPGQELQEGEG